MPKILPNNCLQNTKCLPNKYQNNTKRISKIIPKITTFNTKQMLKEYQRITKIIPKESKIYIKWKYNIKKKHYEVIVQSINRQIIKINI